ncbi:MAG: hypothetical protein PHE25_04325 [Candidatus Gracilibacteria bacterium]|nr:hypothetical protein [Candidatus Gracilibacteria bacterium]
MIKEGKGGGNTKTGLHFEGKVSFEQLLSNLDGYKVEKKEHFKEAFNVYFDGNKIAETYKKHDLYKGLLIPKGIDFKGIISKKLLPDNAIYVISNDTLFIIEIKYQQVAGSVDEKLQTCDFKNKQYRRLLKPIGIDVRYCYILSDWFMKPEYKDVLNYIQAMDCHYFFGELPLDFLGLPTKNH